MQSHGDVDDDATLLLLESLVKGLLAHVEGPDGIDLNDSLDGVSGDHLSSGQEIASCTVHKDIESTELLHDFLDHSSAVVSFGHITWDGSSAYLLRNFFVLLFVTAHKNDSRGSMILELLANLHQHTSS